MFVVSHTPPRLGWGRLMLGLAIALVAQVGHADDRAGASPEGPDSHRSETIDPEDRGAIPSDPGDLAEQPTDLDALDSEPGAEHAAGDESIGSNLPARDARGKASDPGIATARRRVVEAQERLTLAREAYGRMQRANYPRGEAREEIIAEREAARAELEQAKQALRELDPSLPAASED